MASSKKHVSIDVEKLLKMLSSYSATYNWRGLFINNPDLLTTISHEEFSKKPSAGFGLNRENEVPDKIFSDSAGYSKDSNLFLIDISDYIDEIVKKARKYGLEELKFINVEENSTFDRRNSNVLDFPNFLKPEKEKTLEKNSDIPVKPEGITGWSIPGIPKFDDSGAVIDQAYSGVERRSQKDYDEPSYSAYSFELGAFGGRRGSYNSVRHPSTDTLPGHPNKKKDV